MSNKPCDLGVGCEEAGVCFAAAHGEPHRCPLNPPKHAKLAPSAAHRWIPCPGSVVLEEGRPEVETEEQAEGQLLHAVAADALNHVLGKPWGNLDDEQREAVQTYVDRVREYASAEGAVLLVEQRVPVGHVTGEEGAEGTADAIVLLPGEIQVHDAKFGRVRVAAEGNPQTAFYALGAIAAHELSHGPFERVRLVIHQPRLGVVDEWVASAPWLEDFVDETAAAVQRAQWAQQYDPRAFLRPGEVQCHYCRAKPVCPALRKYVEDAIGSPLATLAAGTTLAGAPSPNLAEAKRAAPLIRQWCDAIDEEVARLLNAGTPVEGFKLVRGRQGNRQWSDPAEAERLLVKSFRLKADEAYTRKLISPTKAEELVQRVDKAGKVKADTASRPLRPGQWKKLQSVIVRLPGALVVAPESDKREAVAPVAEHFTDESIAGLL